mmetsp:Transcript_310/g.418  ORF Transcript_310/g.418 Transcript_310/m.418 type:complete len:756 (+) Transcript_310:143-2410(+)
MASFSQFIALISFALLFTNLSAFHVPVQSVKTIVRKNQNSVLLQKDYTQNQIEIRRTRLLLMSTTVLDNDVNTRKIQSDEVVYPGESYLESGTHNIKDIEEYKSIYQKSIENPASFWSDIANNFFWKTPFDPNNVLQYNFDRSKGPVYVKWFENGTTNICFNALDRMIEKGLGDRVAFTTERNDIGEESLHQPQSYTYSEALSEINRLANYLKSQGVQKGDKVGIFMPMVSELPIAMLACARIGAVHTVVFGGFSKESLAGRLLDAGCKAVISCDAVMRGAKEVPLFNIMDGALEICKEKGLDIKTNVVLKRLGEKTDVALKADRDVYWDEAVQEQSTDCEPEWVEAEHPLFILYTSGSTGKPKGVLHTTGGYMVSSATTFKYIFNVQPDQQDVWFCTADCGWITGHSYVTYGPLLNGATQVIFEGNPFHPDVGRLWDIVNTHKVTHLYTAPTAIRALMKHGEDPVKKYSRSSLRLLGSVGEPINPEAWKWYHRVVGEERCPIVDTWWQTETGSIMISPQPVKGFGQKPGSATLPFFGVQPTLLDKDGKEIEGATDGLLAIKHPWPSTIRSVNGDHKRMEDTYFSFNGYYLTGDNARRDEDGCYWITGRADDVVIVSGHNIGTAEVESALVKHPAVSEAAVVGAPDEMKGNSLYCYVILAEGFEPSKPLCRELKKGVAEELGAFFRPDAIQFSAGLPKTRSGKIMRRILRKIAELGTSITKEDLGDVSTLAEPEVVDTLIAEYASNTIGRRSKKA